MRKRLFTVLTLYIICVLTAFAQEKDKDGGKNQFDIDLNMLGRGEMRYGGFTEDNAENRAQFLLERTRLSLGYKRPYIEAKVTAQHSGVWGTMQKKTNKPLKCRGLFVYRPRTVWIIWNCRTFMRSQSSCFGTTAAAGAKEVNK